MNISSWDRIYIVGAGPGNADLLTIKAGHLIGFAQLILHDGLVSDQILSLAPENCQLINTGKRAGDGKDQNKRQADIIEKLEEAFREGKNVLRLKGGDPMVFGRGAEEYDALKKKRIPVEIVPGISSGLAAGSLIPLPLTEREKSESLMIITGSTVENITRNPELLAMQLKTGNTAILYMGHGNLAAITALMVKMDVKKDLPVAAISKVSLSDQKIVITTLSNVEADLTKTIMERPLVFILGEHVRDMNFQVD